jgi:hypothetical protein
VGKKKFDMDKIDKLLAQYPDEGEAPPKAVAKPGEPAKPALPAGKPGRRSAAQAVGDAIRRHSPLVAWISVSAGVILAVAMTQWPYGYACGSGLAIYLLAIMGVLLVGAWAGIHTWKARLAIPHVIALAVCLWGGGLALFQVLPRVGYAKDEATWRCWGQAEVTAPAVSPVATQPAAAQATTLATDSVAAQDSVIPGDSLVPGDSAAAVDSAAVADTIPVAGDTIPVAGDTIPVAGDTIPVAGDTIPVAGDSLTMAAPDTAGTS